MKLKFCSVEFIKFKVLTVTYIFLISVLITGTFCVSLRLVSGLIW